MQHAYKYIYNIHICIQIYYKYETLQVILKASLLPALWRPLL